MKILISDRMLDIVVDMFRQIGVVVYLAGDKDRLMDELKGADVLVVRSATKVNKEVIDSAQNLKIIARAGVGLDNIDVEYAESKGVRVINAPGASTNAVAEHTIGLMLSVFRHIPFAHSSMKSGKWEKKRFMGRELSGKTLGIIGFGHIGSTVAKKAKCLGMNVLAYDVRKKESDLVQFVDLDKLLSTSDVVTLHMALVESTMNFMNKSRFDIMKKSAVLINTARGGLVDENALYDALKSGHLSGAGLDVYPEEPYSGRLLELDNVVFTPHIAGSTQEAQLNIGRILIDKIKSII